MESARQPCRGYSTRTFKKAFPDVNELFVKKEKVVKELLFLLVTVSSRTLFSLVRRYLMSLSFFTTWHRCEI